MVSSGIEHENLITVRFTEDFAPYGITKGGERKVSENVAKKLLEDYGVIEDYRADEWRNKMIMVRAQCDLNKELGRGWYVNTTHLVLGRMVEQYIKDGRLIITHDPYDPNSRSTQESVKAHVESEMSDEKWAAWFKSHKDYNGQSIEYIKRCISLALQCGGDRASEIIDKCVAMGAVKDMDEKIVWEGD